MNRAHETAQPLTTATGHEITLDAGLKEFDSHLNFYVPIEELRADEEAWSRLVAEWLSPEAEEERQRFRAGVVATIDKIVAQHAGERVAVVVATAASSTPTSRTSSRCPAPCGSSRVHQREPGDHERRGQAARQPQRDPAPPPPGHPRHDGLRPWAAVQAGPQHRVALGQDILAARVHPLPQQLEQLDRVPPTRAHPRYVRLSQLHLSAARDAHTRDVAAELGPVRSSEVGSPSER